jgi:flagellar basal-body rod protein FlgF/flagellar basal-body rod protein FlgG
MNSGFYAAATGLVARLQALDVAANNIANSGATGYKAQKAFYSALQTQMASPSVTMASGVPRQSAAVSAINQAVNNFGVLGGARTDFSQGSLDHTGNPLDMAVNGPGFISVAGSNGTAYTRNGQLALGPHGELLTSAGAAVLGKNGPIQLPPGEMSVGSDGTISVDGTEVDQIQMVEFAKSTPPQALGASLFVAPPGVNAQPAASSSMQQGFLEGSNTDVISGTVGLVELQRGAEMLEKALTMFNNDFNKTVIDEVAKTT